VAASHRYGRNEIGEMIFWQRTGEGVFRYPEKQAEKMRGDYKKRALSWFTVPSDNALWWLGS